MVPDALGWAVASLLFSRAEPLRARQLAPGPPPVGLGCRALRAFHRRAIRWIARMRARVLDQAAGGVSCRDLTQSRARTVEDLSHWSTRE